WGSKQDIRVVDTNYNEYALVATQINKDTSSSTMVLLYSRTKKISPERLERFTEFSKELGLTDEEITILPETGEKLEGQGSGGRRQMHAGCSQSQAGGAASGRGYKGGCSLSCPHPAPRARTVAMLPSFALALLCLLQAGAQVPMPSPDPTGDVLLQFAATWHVAATVSNCSVFLKMKDRTKLSIVTISFTPEGDLAMKLVWPWRQHKRDLHVMETDYSHFAIVHELQQSGQKPMTALQLFTREQDVSPQLLKKFKELIPSTGLSQDMLAILPQSGECQAGVGWYTQPLRLAGIWYVTARAPNFKVSLQGKDMLKTVMARFKILDDGKLKVTLAFP
ncbi:PREDICTED: lipocalin-15, partial [Buceros rhinoceros silvestris]|uniref:lipocalin-15 n=1 Tax=Buceros rhinoceros silvestris TaxID=175836 RepID=UPI0005281468